MVSEENIRILSEVKKGRQRRIVLKVIDETSALMVSEIYNLANNYIRNSKQGKEIRLSDISRTLKRLSELGLVVCLNPLKIKGEKGILYQLTETGQIIQKLL